jgi:glycosidase
VDVPGWAKEAIIYQIFPDRFYNGDLSNDPPLVAQWGDSPTRQNFFGGDLAGIIQKLDYIQSLGVDTIYLTPIFSAPSNHKYDTKDYYQVDSIFGGNSALRELIDSLHARGMKLILDGVFNHCGEQFFAYQDVLFNGRASDYTDWFTIHGFPLTKEPLNYTCCGDASYLPKLNHNNQEVNEYFLDVGKYWIEEYGADGWRLDVPFKISKNFWGQFRKATKSVNPECYLFGEVWRNGWLWLDEDSFDGVTNYPLRQLILDFCQTNFLDAEDYLFEAQSLRESYGDEAYSMVNLLGSHDTPRILTMFEGDTAQTILAWVLLLTEVGNPLIYYGDEIGMAGGNDPDCRRTMIWDEAKQEPRILEVVRLLTGLRKRSKILTAGKFENLFAFIGLAAYKRVYKDEEIIVIMNSRERVEGINIPVNSGHSSYFVFPGNEKVDVQDGKIYFDEFPAYSYEILTTQKY